MELSTDTPHGRVMQSGIASAQNADLLAICSSREAKDAARTFPQAVELIKNLGSERLHHLSQADLRDIGGLEGYEADRILAAIELGRRSRIGGRGEVKEITGAALGAKEFGEFLYKAPEERFCIAILTTKNTVIAVREIHRGAIDSSVVDPKIVFGRALRENASRIILGHNHPSGDPEPSPEDISVTRRLVEGGRILDLEVLDHIIVGHAPDGKLRYTSLRQRGLM